MVENREVERQSEEKEIQKDGRNRTKVLAFEKQTKKRRRERRKLGCRYIWSSRCFLLLLLRN